MEERFKDFRIGSLFLWAGLFFIILEVIVADVILKGSIVGKLISSYLFSCMLAYYIFRKLKNLQVDIRKFVGEIPQGYDWKNAIYLLIVLLVFHWALSEFALYALSKSSFSNDMVSWLNSNLNAYRIREVFDSIRLVIIVPIIQEAIRGIFIRKLMVKGSVSKAIILSTVLVSIFFLNLFSDFVFGIIMAIIYIKTRTILIPIFFNIIDTALQSFMSLVFLFSGNYFEMSIPSSILLLSFILIIVSLPILIYYIYKNWPEGDSITPDMRNSV